MMVLGYADNVCVKYLNEFTRDIFIRLGFRYFCAVFLFENETYKILPRRHLGICYLGILQSGFKAFTRLSFSGYFILQGISLCGTYVRNQFRL